MRVTRYVMGSNEGLNNFVEFSDGFVAFGSEKRLIVFDQNGVLIEELYKCGADEPHAEFIQANEASAQAEELGLNEVGFDELTREAYQNVMNFDPDR